MSNFFRKVPLLRLCYAQREGEWWLKEMPQEIIDFEVCLIILARFEHKFFTEYFHALCNSSVCSSFNLVNVNQSYKGYGFLVFTHTKLCKICSRPIWLFCFEFGI